MKQFENHLARFVSGSGLSNGSQYFLAARTKTIERKLRLDSITYRIREITPNGVENAFEVELKLSPDRLSYSHRLISSAKPGDVDLLNRFRRQGARLDGTYADFLK